MGHPRTDLPASGSARFMDKEPDFLFVAPDPVIRVAEDLGKFYDVPDVEYTHVGDGCSFGTLDTRFESGSKLSRTWVGVKSKSHDEIQRVFHGTMEQGPQTLNGLAEFAKQRRVIFGRKHRGHSSAKAVKDEKPILVVGERLPSA